MTTKRTVFFISDSTAITAETLGQSLLSQFDHMQFSKITLPFIDNTWKAEDAVIQINDAAKKSRLRPIVFSTLTNAEIRQQIMSCEGVIFDFFDTFIGRLENELHMESSHAIGRYHGIVNDKTYHLRMDSVNYALNNDDGITTKYYNRADVVLVGVSRTGKTPTCIYLALQFGIYAANYPLTEEDIAKMPIQLPAVLLPFKKKLYGLTINPERLHIIRSERRRDSRYASISQCQHEVKSVESLYTTEHIPFLNISFMSVEEIATTVLHATGLHRLVF
jgi:hypothetical protein